MQKAVFALIIAALIGGKCGNLFGQDVKTQKHWLERHPVDFAIGNFSVGMPFSKVFINRFYPLATLGTEFYYREGEHSQIYQTVKIGGYYNKYNTAAFFVNTEVACRYTFNFGLFADANLGVGYSHLFHPNAIYKPDGNGGYERVRDWGKPSLMTDFLLSVGYDCSKRLNKSIVIFLRYGNFIQLFYNPDIPALPQNSFQTGIRIQIRQNQHIIESK